MRRLGTRTETGFTLVEILVVIAVIAILAAIAIPQLSAYRRRGFDTDIKSNIKNATISQEAYYTDKHSYSSELADLQSWGFLQSPGVNITASGGATTFVISGEAIVGCTPGTGIWSFASTSGITTGAACN